MEFSCTNPSSWKSALWSYETSLDSLQKPDLIPLDAFYRKELPLLIRQREPQPFITQPELRRLLQWKLSRGKWRFVTVRCLPKILAVAAAADFSSESESEDMKRRGMTV